MITLDDFEAGSLFRWAGDLSEERLAYWVSLIALAGVVGGIYAFIKGMKSQRILRLIENIPTSSIRSVALGLVEVKGQALPFGNPLKAPFSEELCVYYQIKIYEHTQNSTTLILKEESHDRFYLQDETGKMLVSPVGADVEVESVYEYTDAQDNMPFNAERKLQDLGLSSSTTLRGSMSIKEYVIGVGQEVYILGSAVQLLSETISSDPFANIIIKKGVNDPFFMISNQSEKDLQRSNRFWVQAGILGGPALALAGLGILTYLIFTRSNLLQGLLNS